MHKHSCRLSFYAVMLGLLCWLQAGCHRKPIVAQSIEPPVEGVVVGVPGGVPGGQMGGVIGGVIGGAASEVHSPVAPKSARVGSSGSSDVIAKAARHSVAKHQPANLKQQTQSNAGSGEPAQEAARSGTASQQSPYGNVVFRSEEKMQVGHTYPVFVLLSPTSTKPALTSLLRSQIESARSSTERAAPDTGTITAETVAVSPRMRAHLTANADEFEISQVTSEDQDTTFESVTTWQWMVKPLRSGTDLKLDLTISVILDGTGTPHAVNTYHRFIKVEVPLLALFSRVNWQWILSTLLIPAGAWLWKRKKTNQDTRSS